MKDSFGVEVPSSILDDPELGKLAGIHKVVEDSDGYRHIRWHWRGRDLEQDMAVNDRNHIWALATAMRDLMELGASRDHPLEIFKIAISHSEYPWVGARGCISVLHELPEPVKLEELKE